MPSEADIPNVLTVVKGSTKPIEVTIFDNNEELEDLSGQEAATLVVRETATSSDYVLLLRTVDNNLEVDAANSKLIGTPSQSQANDLTPGTYIGSIAVKFNGKWEVGTPFSVVIKPEVAETP